LLLQAPQALAQFLAIHFLSTLEVELHAYLESLQIVAGATLFALQVGVTGVGHLLQDFSQYFT
jgi:choline-glycine betaine transporter